MACLLVLAFSGDWSPACSATINVPSDSPTIQSAITASSAGDVVIVAPGVYREPIVFPSYALRVASANGPAVTTINGNGVGPVVLFTAGAMADTVLAGFTITGGINSSSSGLGGGIRVGYYAAPTIFGNIITGNSACFGGAGIAVEFASPIIQSNTITNNTQTDCTGGGGAGILMLGAGSGMILSNTISNNCWSSGDGGGVLLDGARNALIPNHLITGN